MGSLFSTRACQTKAPAWCFEAPNINKPFDEASDMTARLKCDFNKNICETDLDCNEENLILIQKLYEQAITPELTPLDIAVVYSHYAYFLLFYINNISKAKNYSEQALIIDNNNDLALFVNVMCDCFQDTGNSNYAILIERIKNLDKKNRVVPLMYHCLFTAYIETYQVCKAEGLVKSGKFKKDPLSVRLFLRWELRDAKKEQHIRKCNDL